MELTCCQNMYLKFVSFDDNVNTIYSTLTRQVYNCDLAKSICHWMPLFLYKVATGFLSEEIIGKILATTRRKTFPQNISS